MRAGAVAGSLPRLPPESHLDALTLRTSDPEAMLGFYRDDLGLALVEERDDRLVLAPAKRAFELVLQVDTEAPVRPPGTVGLYHLALLLPDRPSLAAVLQRLAEEGAGFVGFADHGVSEAAYLSDPEGNGIELYRDRDPDTWPRRGREIAMVTEPLDVGELLETAEDPAPLDPATRLGHVHLHAGDVEASGRFYVGLGLSITQSTYPGALFLAAGDYHHHVGLNEWARGRRAPPGATGLLGYRWRVPAGALGGLVPSWGEAITVVEEGKGRAVTEDPDGHRVVLAEA